MQKQTKAAMEGHIKVHHPTTTSGDTVFICKSCPSLKFINPASFRLHQRQHQEGSFHCHICNMSFNTQTRVRGHLDSHVPGGVGNCPVPGCTVRIVSASNYSRHLKLQHPGSTLKFKRDENLQYETTAEWKERRRAAGMDDSLFPPRPDALQVEWDDYYQMAEEAGETVTRRSHDSTRPTPAVGKKKQ